MEITKEFKKVLIDILVRLAQIAFVAFVVTPFVTGKFNQSLQIFGGAIFLFSVGCALLIALAIREVE